jgi:uncharacterized protein YjbI with pentapeptide repeats
MDQQQQPRWRPIRRWLLWTGGVVTLVILLTVAGGYLFGWKWTGLSEKTFWDWLKLLIVPIVLSVGGYLFTHAESRAVRVATVTRAQDEALQAYLDQIGQMLLDKDRPLRQSKSSDDVRILARARTLTVLSRLDGPRKGEVVQFLYESGLISRRWVRWKQRPIVRLIQADLAGADLSERYLEGADLRGTNLTGATLQATYLEGAHLNRARLERAYLSRARLDGVNFSHANLKGADLSDASLINTNLRYADLRGASLKGADLTEASLTGAKLINASLREANLRDATMPNGQKYEDWLIDKESHGEDE